MDHYPTPLVDAVRSWLASMDVIADGRQAGPFGFLRDGLSVLVPIAEAAPASPVRDALLALAEVYDDLCILGAAGLELSEETRGAAVTRVVDRFEALARLVGGE